MGCGQGREVAVRAAQVEMEAGQRGPGVKTGERQWKEA